VRRGIATGANDFFVMNRIDAKELGIPDSVLRPVLPKARTLKTDVVEKAKDGYPQVQPQLCVLDSDLPEMELKARYPLLMKYLKSAESLGIRERNLIRNRHPWYKQEQRDPAIFLCTYMGRAQAGSSALRFIWNKSNAIATNTYLMLYPRSGLEALFRKRPTTVAKVFALLKDAACDTMDEQSRMHAGGLHKIEPRELLEVRLPSIPNWLKPAVTIHLDLT
jgi:hypothetical protein